MAENPKDSPGFYKSLFDNMLDGLAYGQVVFDSGGNPIDYIYITVNKNFEKLTGLKNVIGKKVTEVLVGIETSNPEWLRVHFRVALTGKPERIETYIEQISRWFRVSLYRTEKNFFVSIFQNITDQKQIVKNLEDAMIASRNVFEDLELEKEEVEKARAKEEAILLSIGNGLLVVDEKENITLMNKTAEKLLGRKNEEVMGKVFAEVVPAENEEGALIPLEKRPIKMALATSTTTTTSTTDPTLYYVRKDKTRFPVAITATPVLLNGKIIGAVIVFQDITDRRQAEEKLTEERRRSEDLAKNLEKFKLAVDNVSDVIIITDMEGIVVYANGAVEKITGYKPQEITGKKAAALWKSPMPLESYQKIWDTIKNQKKIFIGEIQNKRKNGEIFTAAISISPILDEKGEAAFFVGIERDVTQEKKIEHAKDEFVSLASHQLRTPPTIIEWYTEMLQSGDLGPIPEKQAKYLTEIYRANQRMILVINSMLNISRVEMGTFGIHPKKIDLRVNIEESIKELGSRFNREAEIKKNYASSLGLVNVDPGIMTIIIDNLLSNAYKYSPPENTKIAVTAKVENGSLLLSIKDNGIGILPKDENRIFEKMFRADNAVALNPNGTGLGLYMIKRIIVDGLGGKIWFDSKKNEGATFYVSLPVSDIKEKLGTSNLTRI
jgi:PAS domain S-box-containing protein